MTLHNFVSNSISGDNITIVFLQSLIFIIFKYDNLMFLGYWTPENYTICSRRVESNILKQKQTTGTITNCYRWTLDFQMFSNDFTIIVLFSLFMSVLVFLETQHSDMNGLELAHISRLFCVLITMILSKFSYIYLRCHSGK